MESPSNPNFRRGNRDRIRFAEDLFPSISRQNLQIETRRQETANTEQFLQDLFLSNSASEQNFSVNNPTAAETESMRQQQPEPVQRQPADISSADSHSRINCIPEITAPDRRAKKREADRKYRQKMKENKQQMKFHLKRLKAENGSLKNENNLGTQKFQEELDNWKKKYEKQQETLEAKIESLKNKSILATQKFQSQSEELENWKKKYEKQQASRKSFSDGPSMAGSPRNLIGPLGQQPNLETAGFMHSSQATVLPPLSPSLPVDKVRSSPATAMVPPSPRPSSPFGVDFDKVENLVQLWEVSRRRFLRDEKPNLIP